MSGFVQPRGCKCTSYGAHRQLLSLPRRRPQNCAAALPKERTNGSSVIIATLIGAAPISFAGCVPGATIAGCQAGLPSSAHAADSIQSLVHTIPSPVADIADEVPFWANVLRYVQYFFSIMLGTGYVMLKPFAQLLRNPVTGVLVIAAAVGLVIGVKITVTAMLGVDDLFDYQASSIVTAQGM